MVPPETKSTQYVPTGVKADTKISAAGIRSVQPQNMKPVGFVTSHRSDNIRNATTI